MRMTSGDPVCDLCNWMWPDEYIELWPVATEGPPGPDRFESDSFGVCPACIRRRFAADYRAELARQRQRHRENQWLRQAVHDRERLAEEAEACLRDIELGGAA